MSDHCSDDIDQALAIMSSTAAQLALPLRAGTTSHAA
jgi:hypothetical protein